MSAAADATVNQTLQETVNLNSNLNALIPRLQSQALQTNYSAQEIQKVGKYNLYASVGVGALGLIAFVLLRGK